MEREVFADPPRTIPNSASECLTCDAYGVVEKAGSEHPIVWYRWIRGSNPHPQEIGREPWPYTSKSPYCPECWAKIKAELETVRAALDGIEAAKRRKACAAAMGLESAPAVARVGADARGMPAGTLVTCEHCPTPHPKDDNGTKCRFPKVAKL